MKRKTIIILIILVAIILAVFLVKQKNQSIQPLVNITEPVVNSLPEAEKGIETAIPDNPLPPVESSKGLEKSVSVNITILPESFDLKPAFASQAPFGNWGLPYQEACEEASMIIVAKYFKRENLNKQIMDEEIKKLVDWEKKNLGYYEHTTIEEVKNILEDYFNLKAEVSNEVEVERIKHELFKGNLIIVPCSGRDLPNPYFKQPGPVYHMLVIRGWKKDKFITNDPGTKNGEGFAYKYEDLIKAIHNPPFSGSEPLTQELLWEGEKKMVVVGD